MTDQDRPRPQPRIPIQQWPDFEVVVDVKIMARTSFDTARAYRRIRVPLANVVQSGEPPARPDHDLEEIRERYANGFGDIEVAAEDVATLLSIIDEGPDERFFTARQVLLAAVGSALWDLIEESVDA